MKKTTLCYIKRGDEYLLLYRNKKKNDENEGKWVGVGGKFEPGETPEECLVREVYEETGLTLTGYIFHGIVGFRSDKWGEEDMYLYTGTEFTGEIIRDCDEGELRWISKDKMLELPMWEGDKLFLKPMLEGEVDIDMTLCYVGDKLIDVKG